VNEGVPSARGATTIAADARFSEAGTSATGTEPQSALPSHRLLSLHSRAKTEKVSETD